MTICDSHRLGVKALLLAMLLSAPSASILQAQTASYLDHDGLTRELRSITGGSNLATMESLGATLQGREIWLVTVADASGAPQVVSAARGKLCYNVESHIDHGCTGLHQPVVGEQELLRDFLPQIGLGIRGFLFWQYRPEVLGREAPAWGLVRPDGSDRRRD